MVRGWWQDFNIVIYFLKTFFETTSSFLEKQQAQPWLEYSVHFCGSLALHACIWPLLCYTQRWNNVKTLPHAASIPPQTRNPNVLWCSSCSYFIHDPAFFISRQALLWLWLWHILWQMGTWQICHPGVGEHNRKWKLFRPIIFRGSCEPTRPRLHSFDVSSLNDVKDPAGLQLP